MNDHARKKGVESGGGRPLDAAPALTVSTTETRGVPDMSYIEEANDRASAVKYMRRQLRQGKSFAEILLQTVDFEQGDIATLSPTALSPTETIQFDWGHTPQAQTGLERIKIGDTSYIAVPTANANKQLAEAIYELLRSPESVCLLENALAEAHDSWLKRTKSRVVFNGTEVYHVLFNADRDKDKIEDAIRDAHHSPVLIGAVGYVRQDGLARIALGRAINTELLTAFAETVQSVFVGAYDGEGYIVWNKPST